MTISQYRQALHKHRLAIVALGVIGGIGALIYSLLQPVQYQASAQIVVTSNVTALDAAQLSQGGNYVIQRVRSYALIGNSDPVMSAVVTRLNLPERPDQLSSHITVQAPPGTSVLNITARAGTPQQARQIAEGTAEELQHFIEGAEAPMGGRPPVRLVLSRQAVQPMAPVSPDTTANVALGLIAGLVTGLGAAVGSFALDRRVRDADHAGQAAGLPVIAVVPPVPDGLPLIDGRAMQEPLNQAFHKLLTNLRVRSSGQRMSSFAVTSPAEGDGRSTVAADLAIAFATAGHAVVLVDGDGGSTTHLLGLPDTIGLPHVLQRRVTLKDALRQWRPELPLYVLTAGRDATEPGWVPDPGEVAQMLTGMRGARLVAVIDCPPALPASRPPVLAAAADATLLTARPGWTAFEDVSAAVRDLSAVNAKPIGVVVVQSPVKDRRESVRRRWSRRKTAAA